MSEIEEVRENNAGAPRVAKFIAMLAAGLLLASCASLETDRFGLSEASAARDDVASNLPPEQRKEHERLVAAYGGVYHSPDLEQQISKTVDRLVAASERPDIKYRVTLLNSPAINAFALPGGTLYVTRGLVALANDSSEMSSVLAHEMAHVIARHAAIREDQVRQAMIVSRVISDVVNDPDLGALALAKSKISLASFSQGQELEADAVGVGISSRAGYDPYGASRFLTAMGKYAELKSGTAPVAGQSGKDQVDFISSHPSTPARISIAVANAKQYSATPTERDHKEFIEALDGLVYGDDPKEGYVRGRTFLHPNLGFTFTAPDGFSLENTPQAVLGATSSGKEALRLDAVRVPAMTALTSYLASGWIDGVDRSSVQPLTISGFPAATALARGDQWSFRLYAIRFGSDVYRLVFAARQISPERDQIFRAAADSFRRVGADEAKNVKPLRISIVRVGLTDTVEKLARRMAVADKQLERFLVLNGIDRDAKLKFGEKVKIVVE
jgi:predicted Zn-dependent protease